MGGPPEIAPRNRNSTDVVHLELHTADLARACSFYARLLGYRFETVTACNGTYLAMDLGGELGGGVVECSTRRPGWLPYVEVSEIAAATAQAHELGAAVLLESREGPGGWRSVVSHPEAGELALWQPKSPCSGN